MALLHSLHLVASGWNAQLERTLRVRLYRFLAGIVHHLSVETELHAWHRNRGVAIIYISTIDEIGVHVEVEVLRPVGVLGEVHLAARVWAGVAGIATLRRNVDDVDAVACAVAANLVRQFAELEVTRLVGDSGVECVSTRDGAFRTTFHCHACTRRAVCHAHVAAHTARRLALARRRRACDVDALALQHALHAIVV